MRILSGIIILLFITSCGIERQIIDKPINFNSDRKELTNRYIEEHYGISEPGIEIEPRMIVLHWTVIPTLEKTLEVFESPYLADSRTGIKEAGALNVSSHFVVDRDGTIYRLMPETYMARHVIGLNYSSIGIENVGGTDDLPLTNAQLKANVKLCKYLADKYEIEYVIGHYEYTSFENHPLWKELDDGYRTEKDDPGKEFTKAVRKKLKSLDLKEVPGNN